ncbi:hypothetical protein [Paenibacillus sp. 1P03SA]|uniref:hypothetical protein n=1 Tax=Paenibacillus sp. 1P03SA TaxID=3132294 RepID=UPI0039A2FE8D
MNFKVGDKVKWTSQSYGVTKEKRGTVHAVIKPNENAMSYLPREMKPSQRKFDTYWTVYTRYIVAVPRGGKSVLTDYYCPRPPALEIDDTHMEG